MTSANDLPIIWLKGEIKNPPFSIKARIESGFFLRKIQQRESLSMPHSRPMPSIGKNCHELRIVDQDKTWRIIYLVEPDAIVILDVFAKKTNQTPLTVINGCKKRIKAYREI